MECYLVRHGEAQHGPEGSARPLTARGREEIRQVARYAAALGIQVAEIRHSGLVRARETAEILASHLAPRRGIGQADGLAPEDDPQTACAAIEAVREPVMLVGHLPHLGRLASALVLGSPAREVVRFRPGTVACLAKAGGGWVVEWVVTPALAGAGGKS